MKELNLLTLVPSSESVWFGLLILVLGWLGNKLYDKLCLMSESQARIESVLHKRITSLDRRLTAVEVRCSLHHEEQQ